MCSNRRGTSSLPDIVSCFTLVLSGKWATLWSKREDFSSSSKCGSRASSRLYYKNKALLMPSFAFQAKNALETEYTEYLRICKGDNKTLRWSGTVSISVHTKHTLWRGSSWRSAAQMMLRAFLAQIAHASYVGWQLCGVTSWFDDDKLWNTFGITVWVT